MASVTVNPTSRSNTFTAGPNTFLPASSSAVSLIVKGAVSQTGDLEQWQNSAGTVLSKITSAGTISSSVDATINGLTVGRGLAGVTDNTAVGFESLFSVTTAGQSTAVGYRAGKAITTGAGNTAVGNNALRLAVTTQGNTAVGGQAFETGVGGFNTMIGYLVARVSTGTAAIENAAVGYAALYALTTGAQNSAFGARALQSNTTGSNNTSLGDSAGFSNTTGSGSVFLGWNAGYNETGSNKLYIANTSTATPLIGGDFSTASLTIGGSLSRGAPVTKTADFTLASAENWVINNKSGSSCVVTFPSASTYSGREVMLNNYQAQTVVSASSNVVPQGGGAAGTAILAATVGKWATLVSDGTNWIIMESN